MPLARILEKTTSFTRQKDIVCVKANRRCTVCVNCDSPTHMLLSDRTYDEPTA